MTAARRAKLSWLNISRGSSTADITKAGPATAPISRTPRPRRPLVSPCLSTTSPRSHRTSSATWWQLLVSAKQPVFLWQQPGTLTGMIQAPCGTPSSTTSPRRAPGAATRSANGTAWRRGFEHTTVELTVWRAQPASPTGRHPPPTPPRPPRRRPHQPGASGVTGVV